MDSARVEVTVCIPNPEVGRNNQGPWLYRPRPDLDFDVSGDCISDMIAAAKELGAVVDGGQYVVRQASPAGDAKKPHIVLHLIHKTHKMPSFATDRSKVRKGPR